MLSKLKGKKKSKIHLSNFTEATGVNRSVLSGNRHYVPALILGLATAAPRGVLPTTAPSTRIRVFLGKQLLLDFDLLSVFFQLSLFVDLINGLGTKISSPGHPVVLWQRTCAQLKEWGNESPRKTKNMFFFNVNKVVATWNEKDLLNQIWCYLSEV